MTGLDHTACEKKGGGEARDLDDLNTSYPAHDYPSHPSPLFPPLVYIYCTINASHSATRRETNFSSLVGAQIWVGIAVEISNRHGAADGREG